MSKEPVLPVKCIHCGEVIHREGPHWVNAATSAYCRPRLASARSDADLGHEPEAA